LRQYLDGLDRFELHDGCRALYDFVVNDLSRTYVQLTRERADEDARVGALLTRILRECLAAIAPIAPHVSEMAYQVLRDPADPQSVHLCGLPTPGESDSALESSFDDLQVALAGLLAARDGAKLGVRWPVQEARVFGDDGIATAARTHADLLKTKANVRTVTTESLELGLEARPDANVLGKILGTGTGDFLTAFPAFKQDVETALARGASYTWQGHTFGADAFRITRTAPEGWLVVPCGKGYAAIRTALTPELENEGFAREIARRIQQLRKSSGLAKADRITAAVATHDKRVRDAVREHAAFIRDRCGADDLAISETLGDAMAQRADEKVKGIAFCVGLRRV